MTGLAAKWRREADELTDENFHSGAELLSKCADELEEKRPGADYWVEIPGHHADDPWVEDHLARAGLELLYIGPRGQVSAYLKVRDPDAPPELMHKTVQLTVDMVVADPNAGPPTYKYEVVERKDMHA